MKNLFALSAICALTNFQPFGIQNATAQTPDWAWAKSAGGTSYDYGESVSTDANGNVFVTGGFESSSITFGTTTLTIASADSADIFIAKLDAVSGVNEWDNEETISVYPNPSNGIFTIKNSQLKIKNVEVCNIFGEIIYQSNSPLKKSEAEIDLSSQPSGVYFISLQTEQNTAKQKIIVNK